MPEQPRVFLSSTISDFSDLRVALKYWLEEAGYHVLLSELNDFPVDPASGTFESCINAIESCQYFILLVGFWRGSFYNESQNLSVTRAEYRKACELFERGTLRTVACVRANAVSALRSENANLFEDFAFTKSFVAEIEKYEEVLSGSKIGGPFPRGNWVFRFSDFRDLASALTGTLGVGVRLRRRAIEANLIWELKSNLQKLLSKRNGKITLDHVLIKNVQEELPLTSKHLEAVVDLTKEQANRLAWSSVHLWFQHPELLATSALDDAINSGEYLKYDIKTGAYNVGNMQTLFLMLREEIQRFKQALDPTNTHKIVLHLSQTAKLDQPTMRGIDLAALYHLTNKYHNVLSLTSGLAAYLSGISSELRSWPFSPETPLVDLVDRIKADQPTGEEIEAWLGEHLGIRK